MHAASQASGLIRHSACSFCQFDCQLFHSLAVSRSRAGIESIIMTVTSKVCTLALLAILAMHLCVRSEAVPIASTSGVPHVCWHNAKSLTGACCPRHHLVTVIIVMVCCADTDSAGAMGRSLLGYSFTFCNKFASACQGSADDYEGCQTCAKQGQIPASDCKKC